MLFAQNDEVCSLGQYPKADICKLRPISPVIIRLMPLVAGALGLSACKSNVLVAII